MSQERLIQELEDTKEQLRKQKTLKEMYINRGKETTRELDRLRKYSDDVTLSNAKIATPVRDNTRQKKVEKDKNNLLQKGLDQISVSVATMRLNSGMRLMSLKSDSRLRLSNMSFRRKPCKESSFNNNTRSWKWHKHPARTCSLLSSRWSSRSTTFFKTNWTGSAKGMNLKSSL
ncbi:uncharacterized protein LOC115595216 isoform X2 [Sparus aurata]|uniref:uncharacterized protein LOC115595216 isoform X2 n=1 Tax=Sparus aurata TaxID=8175 RepID=UPI0011C11631|nr:uncharacterized protein LOC115595216 isoform X2 [Sparus aurata]